MAKNQTYKAFTARPSYILNMEGEVLKSAPVLSQLVAEVRGISAYATYVVRNDSALGNKLTQVTATAPAAAGGKAGVKMPDFLASGRTGKSRKERLVQHNVVTSYRSWQERIDAVAGETSKYVNQGWKRTMDSTAPSYGGDFINLGAVDRQYAVIENSPFADGEIVLKMVIRGTWYRLIFSFNNTRFRGGKVTLPLVKVEGNQPVFTFSIVTDNPVVQFSGDYVIGVDVGINNYATVVVYNTKTKQVVHTTTLSQRVHAQWNSVRASEKQKNQLHKKAYKLLYGDDRQARAAALDEARLQREAASRKKRELAILAAQEIAYLSHFYGNAVVAVEDLSWVKNTMQNGRWNRGAFVKWLTHYVCQNGGWVIAVNPANTSQVCHRCGAKVTHPNHRLSKCPTHGEMDRDINAAINIAARAVPKVAKARNTRAKNKKLQPQVTLKTPVARCSLKYPGRDRTKNAPTPKRKKHPRVSREVNLPSSPARVDMTSVLADCGTHGAVGTFQAAINHRNVAYECRLCNLN